MKFRRRVYLHPPNTQSLILRVLSRAEAERMCRRGLAEPIRTNGAVYAIRLTGSAAEDKPKPWSRVILEAVGEPADAHVYSMRLITADRVVTI